MSSARLALMLSAAVACTAAVPASAATPKPCKKGQARWKVEGKTRCVTSRSLNTTVVRPQGAIETEYAIRLIARTTRSKPVARALRRRAAAIAGVAGALETQLNARPRGLRVDGPGREFRATLSAEQALPGGNGVNGKMTASADTETGVLSIGAEFTTKSGADSATSSVNVKVGLETDPGCPDANGRISVRKSFGAEIKHVTKRGGRQLESQSTDSDTTVETIGQNGPDGFLREISSTERTATKVVQRGMTVEHIASATVTGAPGGPVSLQGTPTSDARVSGGGLNRAERVKAERDVAGDAPSDPDLAKKLAETAKSQRDRIREKEKVWTNETSNFCLFMEFDPETVASLEVGASRGVLAKTRIGGGQVYVPATYSVGEVEVGQLSGGGAAGPGGATLQAVGGGPKDKYTVAGWVRSVSLAGRVARRWLASGTELPSVMTGTMKQTTTRAQSGLTETESFSATARWLRSEVTSAPDGTRTAWYTVSEATTSQFSYAFEVGGCGYAVDATGGTPVSGDVELRVEPTGAVRYGFVVDIDLGHHQMHKTSGPPNCPAAGNPQLKAIVQARRAPDSSLYDAPPGALQGTTFSDAREGVTDGIGTAGGLQQITMEWVLNGA